MANLPTSIKNLNTLLGEQLTEGGGGGSSDFSTVEVTIVNNAEDNYTLMFTNIYNDKMYAYLDSEDIDESPVETVLYKGECDIVYIAERELSLSVSGSATISNTRVIVTGDCTITIS